MFSRIIISKYVNNDYKFVKKPLSFKVYHKKDRFSWKSNNEKLVNNIIRAKTNIYDYCLNNEFKYFVTITINSSYNRYDLDWLRRNTSQIIRNLRLKYGLCFKYILIPEKHKNGAWHLHGLFDCSFEKDFYINDNGYLSWKSYDKFGFSSISVIKDYLSCCKYITKYVKKDFESREKTKHLYFCSHNLIKSNRILDLICINDNIDWDYINEYCSLLNVSNDKFINVLDSLKKDIYSVLDDKECLF